MSGASPRVVSHDALRLLAAAQMVQGHTLGALADPAGLVGPVGSAWTFARGLTSVAFLFAAGLSLHLAALSATTPSTTTPSTTTRASAVPASRPLAPRSDAPSALAPQALGEPAAARLDGRRSRGRNRRVRRALSLVALGYLLHLPVGTPLTDIFVVDVLQTIGLSLLGVEALAALLPRPSHVHLACFGLGVACLALAPALADVRAEGPLLPLLAYVTRTGGSLFPVTPFAAFVFFGVAAGPFVLPAGAATPRARTAAGLLGLGVAALAASVAVAPLWPAASAQESPSYALLKLGAVAVAAAVLAFALARVRRLPPVLEALAGETLTLYVVHLLVLYPSYVGLVHHVGPTLDVPAALAMAVALFAVSAGAALVWPRARAALARRLVRSPR
jgi:hypothetical protein